MSDREARHSPRKRYGQHFLTDGRIADRIVESTAPGPDDVVVEIGPGRGVLTERLLDRAGAVIAFEIDRDLCGLLRDRFDGRDSFRLVEGDVLSSGLESILAECDRRVVVVSNLPYNISTPVIDRLGGLHDHIDRAVLMVQREVAQRLLAAPGSKEYGLTTLNLALHAVGRRLFDVSPGSFVPPPKVMSRVILLDFPEEPPYSVIDGELFRRLTGAAFRQRRKMLRNTLIPFIVSCGVENGRAMEIMREAGIDPSLRPERIPVAAFVQLSNVLSRETGGANTETGR